MEGDKSSLYVLERLDAKKGDFVEKIIQHEVIQGGDAGYNYDLSFRSEAQGVYAATLTAAYVAPKFLQDIGLPAYLAVYFAVHVSGLPSFTSIAFDVAQSLTQVTVLDSRSTYDIAAKTLEVAWSAVGKAVRNTDLRVDWQLDWPIGSYNYNVTWITNGHVSAHRILTIKEPIFKTPEEMDAPPTESDEDDSSWDELWNAEFKQSPCLASTVDQTTTKAPV